jgi:hypothetical protein
LIVIISEIPPNMVLPSEPLPLPDFAPKIRHYQEIIKDKAGKIIGYKRVAVVRG